MKAVIQAGGKGTRLRPYTNILPKPLMPVGSKPVLELLLGWLRRNNIEEVFVTTGYLGHLIQSFCGDGGQWDIRITYTHEHEPLGTIGPLTMLREQLDRPFLVLNGDVLTDLNLKAFMTAHSRSGAGVTIATARREVSIDFGVIETENDRVVEFLEKPRISHLVSMGIYCMQPEMLKHIPSRIPFGFDDLMHRMLECGIPAHTFLHRGFWLDVGRVEDFQRAQEMQWDGDVPPFETSARHAMAAE